MQAPEIERKSADTILERGVRVTLPAPRFLRLFGKKKIGLVIPQPTMRTMFTASRLALSAGFTLDEIDAGNVDAALKLIDQHGKTASRIVAVHILNGLWRNRLFSKALGGWLFNRLTSSKLLDVSVTIILMSRYQDFTSTIRLFRSMSMTMMSPKNLSPKEKGSQEAEP